MTIPIGTKFSDKQGIYTVKAVVDGWCLCFRAASTPFVRTVKGVLADRREK